MTHHRIALLLIPFVLVTGCVSAINARNYEPQSGTIDSTYYGCLRDAQHPYAHAVYGQGGGVAVAGQATDTTVLRACMSAAGYQKRAATTAEVVVGLTTAPLWVPLCVVGLVGGVNCLSNQ